MEIVKATIEDSISLTAITKISKAYWGYSDAQIQEWTPQLSISPDYISKNEVFKLLMNTEIIGYYSYLFSDTTTIHLDNIFIHPDFIGKGFGKMLMQDFLARLNSLKVEKVTLEAEPKSEPFYHLFGFKTIGFRESTIQGRMLPLMELNWIKI